MASEGAVSEHVVVLGVEEVEDEVLEVFTTGRIPAPGSAPSAASMILLQRQGPPQSGLAVTVTGEFWHLFWHIKNIFQVVSQILYKTEDSGGRFQLRAGPQGLLVQLAPAETIKSPHNLQVTKSVTGCNLSVTRLNNFGVKFAEFCPKIGVFVILGVLVSSCLVSSMDTPS